MKITNRKERKHWIPNQVGDDIGVVFGDDSYYGSPIKDFEDDRGCAFEDDSSGHSRDLFVIPATYFCHSRELFVIPAKAGIQD